MNKRLPFSSTAASWCIFRPVALVVLDVWKLLNSKSPHKVHHLRRPEASHVCKFLVLAPCTCTCPVMGYLKEAFNAHICARTCPDGSWTGSQTKNPQPLWGNISHSFTIDWLKENSWTATLDCCFYNFILWNFVNCTRNLTSTCINTPYENRLPVGVIYRVRSWQGCLPTKGVKRGARPLANDSDNSEVMSYVMHVARVFSLSVHRVDSAACLNIMCTTVPVTWRVYRTPPWDVLTVLPRGQFPWLSLVDAARIFAAEVHS